MLMQKLSYLFGTGYCWKTNLRRTHKPARRIKYDSKQQDDTPNTGVSAEDSMILADENMLGYVHYIEKETKKTINLSKKKISIKGLCGKYMNNMTNRELSASWKEMRE